MRRILAVCPIMVAVGSLGTLAFSPETQAGLSFSGGDYVGNGGSAPYYDFRAYLDPGSTLQKNDFFTIKSLFGIDTSALTVVPLNANNNQLWTTSFPGPAVQLPLIVNNVNYGSYSASDVRFKYKGATVISSPSPQLLGEFKIFADIQLPKLPEGSLLLHSDTYNLNGPPGGGTVSFLVAPEPSSFVIASLVGTSLMGLALLRRWRRAV